MRKLFIWGAGEIGKRILNHLSDEWMITFVDSNKKIEDSYCYGKAIVSVEEYLERYSDEFIIIAHLQENESIEVLQQNDIINYFVHCDLPGEFKEPYVREDMKKYIINYLGNRNNFILYGLNLYSIIIDEWLDKEYGIHPYILIQDNISKKFVNKIRQKYAGLNLIDDISQLSNIEEICVCSNNYVELKTTHAFTEYCVTDIFDCSDKIASYYNPAIEKFRGLHKDQRCFIVATGPSLKMEDLDVLKQNEEICISMNSIFYAFSETEWRPDYYVMSDYRGFNEYQELLDTLPIKEKILSDNSEEFWKTSHGTNIFRYHEHYEYCFDRLPKFSDDFSKRSYASGTVTYTCMQLAVYMGFKEIYLLGVDFTYGGQQKNVNYYHFYNTEKIKDEGIGYVNNVTLAYQAAKRYADSHGIKIYNATRGGKLEIFERVDFDALFVSQQL